MSDSGGPHDRERLSELFEHAIELRSDERTAFLARACAGDAALLQELTSLLASHDTAPEFLGSFERKLLLAMDGAFPDEGTWIGARVGRYEIVERIGAGGMGIVYKARDAELDRFVALKFLPERLAMDGQARERLKREARAASALDHPNIAVIHEIGTVGDADGEASGRPFIAMAYYEGETLAAMLARGSLPVADATRHAARIAGALHAAHGAGIVHRDIKPANVLVTPSGQLKVLDFGVAKVAGGELTARGSALGTLAYMSPEQTRGDAIDHRTDIWSLGVLLYEMLAGVRPFHGDDDAVVVHALRYDAPPALESIRPDVPPALARIVERCLTKDPAQRPVDAAAVRGALEAALAGRATVADEPSIIVLPFANISADPQDDYFTDGLMEEVIADLSHVRSLRVISRTSAMRYKRTDKDVRTIARETGARYVLEGGVRKAGDALRITVRFVDAFEDRQLWARKFAGTIVDVFEIQEEVARAIVEALRIRLTSGESRSLAERPIPDVRAYESYLRARHEAWSFSPEALERAKRGIESALAIVGDNELLYSTLGHIMASHFEAGIDPDGTARQRVQELARRVFALNPSSARGHFLEAFVAYHAGDLRGAIHAGERAHGLAPDDPDTLLLLGYVYARVGRNADSRRLCDRSVEVDPLTPLTHAVRGFLAILEGRFSDAVRDYRSCLDLDPESAFGAVCYGWALTYDRRFEDALQILDMTSARHAASPFGAWATCLSHAIRGDRDGVGRAVTPEFEATARGNEMFARAIAQSCALVGDRQRALEWLERAIGLGLLNYPYLAEHDWLLDRIRDEPRFATLLDRVRAVSAQAV